MSIETMLCILTRLDERFDARALFQAALILTVAAFINPSASKPIFEINSADARYSPGRVMNSIPPQVIARASPAIVTGTNTRTSGEMGTVCQIPSNLRSSGTMDPMSSPRPMICPAFISG